MRRRTDHPARRPRTADEGVALVTVLGTMAVVTLFLLSSLALVIGQAPKARTDQDAKAAVAAAQAGIDEYVARLTANDSYWTLGADAANPAFTTGRTIQGSAGRAASYRYQLLSTAEETARNGVIRLQATGTSSPGAGAPGVSRTLTATLQPKGFLRFIYFSDVEVLDPELFYSRTSVTVNGNSYWNSGTHGTRYRYVDEGSGVPVACGGYYYAGRSAPTYAAASYPVRVLDTWSNSLTGTVVSTGTVAGFTCLEIQWASGDIVQGPLHSNDALQVGGSPLFTDPVTESSWTNPPDPSRRWWNSGQPLLSSGGTQGYWPVYAAPLAMPNGNSELLKYVEPRIDDPSAAAGPGCLYTGQTRITFQGSTMQVYSPSTTNAPSRCLDTSNRANVQTKTVPPVIYVNDTASCGSLDTSKMTVPRSGEWTGGITTDYSCGRGTAVVQGTVDGQVTVAAKDDVVVTGDVLAADGATGTDMVGLVAGSYVWVYHPVDSSGNNLLSSSSSVHTIQAAVLSLRHSFLVQNWQYGAALSSTSSTSSKLNVLGSISQRYRGPVGTGNSSGPTSGYLKNYVYDQRLKNLQPPYFLKPAATPWQVVTVTDK
ncbi:hypothetical protein [Kineosporia sp. R_H_3]|uniref:hypothetical protein n=1 Tax=Kineosporia sp. R_H_3 TaxID=1961848 RepID=UPI000B4A7DF5|nr:hypothetical protein [Kineosporia sp. R_H_3]